MRQAIISADDDQFQWRIYASLDLNELIIKIYVEFDIMSMSHFVSSQDV